MIGLAFEETHAIAANQSGKALYESNCAVCHGVDGDGAMPGVKDLASSQKWQQQSDDQLVQLIIDGIQSTDSPFPMPPKGGNPDLTEQQIRSIVVYLRRQIAGE